MRLLHVDNLNLVDFGPSPPEYAILSHTWDEHELSYRDVREAPDFSSLEDRPGFSKVQNACTTAGSLGYTYLWVDTCCIDKTSSAEVDEAIRSMFQWYKSARECIVYLSDLEPDSHDDGDPNDTLARWSASRWFTRGWTLQELVAPRVVQFYDKAWAYRGSKTSGFLLPIVSAITRIDEDVLVDSTRMQQVSVARRMSWAAERQTTRVEDMAYSLLGIFDVAVDILYGEGRKAFIRLQEEILKQTTDSSIFAWEATDSARCRGIFAHSPSEFLHFQNKDPELSRYPFEYHGELCLTNKGLRVNAQLEKVTFGPECILHLASYSRRGSSPPKRIGIWLMETSGTFVRVKPNQILVQPRDEMLPERSFRTIYIKKDVDAHTDGFMIPRHPTNTFQPTSHPDGPQKGEQPPKRAPGVASGWEYRLLLDHPRQFSASSSLAGTGNSSKRHRSDSEPPLTITNKKHATLDTPSPTLQHFPAKDIVLARASESWLEHLDTTPDASTSSEFDYASTLGSLEGHTLAVDHPFRQIEGDLLKTSLLAFKSWALDSAHYDLVKDLSFPDTALSPSLQAELARITTRSGREMSSNAEQGKPAHSSKDNARCLFACPYYKRDLQKYLDCQKIELKNVQSVKRHVLRRHSMPFYCPICYKTFSMAADRDTHLVARDCEPVAQVTFQEISEAQRARLTQRPDKRLSHESQWFQIWDIIFPGWPRPPSPYLSTEVSEAMSMLRKFWDRHGREVVGTFLSSRDLLCWELPHEERDLAATYSKTLSSMMDLITTQVMDIASNLDKVKNMGHIAPSPSDE